MTSLKISDIAYNLAVGGTVGGHNETKKTAQQGVV